MSQVMKEIRILMALNHASKDLSVGDHAFISSQPNINRIYDSEVNGNFMSVLCLDSSLAFY